MLDVFLEAALDDIAGADDDVARALPNMVAGAILDTPKAEATGMGLPLKGVGWSGVDDTGAPEKDVDAEEVPNVVVEADPNAGVEVGAEVFDPNAEDPNAGAVDPNMFA